MRYFYTDAQRQPRGPEEREKILELLNSGVINSASLVAAEGSSSWHPISSLSASDNAAAPPLPLNPRPTEPLAVWSLVVSLCSFVCCYFGVATAIAGIVCGHLARGKIKKNANFAGDGLALAGLIIGYVVVVLWLVYFIFILVYTGYGFWESKHL